MNGNWDHLRYFLALADHGTLSAAARSIAVSHSTVLRRVRALEKNLNTHLFDHTNHGFQLTAAGTTLRAEAMKMQTSIDQISRNLTDTDQQIDGEVVITTTDTIAYAIVPDILKVLSDQYPGLYFSLKMINQIADIGNREADIAIRTCTEPPDSLIGRKVGKIPFAACASTDYIHVHNLKEFPITPDSHHFIVLDDSFANVPVYQWLATHVADRGTQTTVGSFLTASAMCVAGMGIAVLPLFLIDQNPSLQRLGSEPEILSNDLWVLSHNDLRNTERNRVVRQYLYQALSERFSSTFRLETSDTRPTAVEV